jgi:O-antigen ligase
MLLKKKKISFGLVATALGFIVMTFVPDYFVERISQAGETGGAGRLDIWYVGWRALEKYWLVGAGFGNFPNAYTEFADYAPHFQGGNRASHNIFVGSFVEVGVIGLSLLVLAIIKHFRLIQLRGIRFDKELIMLNAVFWGMLVSSLFLDTLLYKPFWLLWMMIVMYRNASRKIV